MITNSTPSLSDIAAVTNGNDFGGNNGWWILIILFALFGGWGNGGYGRGNGGAADGYVLASDFANIERKIDGVNNGLCDGFYAQNTNTLNGFSGVQQTAARSTADIVAAVTNGFNTQNLTNLQNANMLQASITGIGTQMQNCCCEITRGQDRLSHEMTTQLNTVMQNCNNNYRMIHDELVAGQMAAKDAKIAEQAAYIQALNLSASQHAQNEYLISQLKTTT